MQEYGRRCGGISDRARITDRFRGSACQRRPSWFKKQVNQGRSCRLVSTAHLLSLMRVEASLARLHYI